MAAKRKNRLNLYISEELVDFAKNWSYVTNVPISRMLEEHLRKQKEIVSQVTPFQWVSDPEVNPDSTAEDQTIHDLEEYLNNREEKEFCLSNPDHPRAKIRRKILREYETTVVKKMESRKKEDKEVIQRWIEVFPLQ